MANIVFIGLGNMGAPMAGHLANAGHQLTVANRSPEKVSHWLSQYPGQAWDGSLPDNTDAVILCVSKDEDVREWLVDKGLLQALGTHNAGAIIIDHSTTSDVLACDMAEQAHKNGVYFCDVPVSGGQQGAQSGQLTLMAGAEEAAFPTIKALTSPYTKAIEHMGPPSSGQKTKMVNQICVAGLIQALAEGVNFSEKMGLNTAKVMTLLAGGAAGSWQMQNRHSTMIDGEFDHGFAIDLMLKDLAICLNSASNADIPLPVTDWVAKQYQALSNQGHGNKDTSALLLALRHDKAQ